MTATNTKEVTYADILKIIEDPKKILGHYLLETLDEKNFVCPEDNDMAVRVYIGGNLITKPHDLNTLLTDWIHRWVKGYLEENYNFSNFERSVKDAAQKLSEEQNRTFFADMYELREKMEEKLSNAFLEIECLDAHSYTASKAKDEKIADLEREVARLKAKAGEPVGLGEHLMAQARVNFDNY